MKFKFISLLVLTAFALTLTGEVWAKDMKFAYINLSLVFDSFSKTKSSDADLQKEAEGKTKDREKLVEAVKKLRDEQELLSQDKKADKQAEIDNKVQELQAFDRDSRLTLQRKRDEMIRGILKQIDDVVQKYGQQNGYDYIFNDRVLLFKKEENDISQKIIDLLNGR